MLQSGAEPARHSAATNSAPPILIRVIQGLIIAKSAPPGRKSTETINGGKHMKVKIEGIRGYDYEKNGTRKKGIMLEVRGTELYAEDDGKGNFKYGYLVEEVFLPRSLAETTSASDLQQFIGREVDLNYAKNLGDRYERLVNISMADDDG